MQRARLLGAAVAVVEEVGWPGVTVAHIAARARVSRRTFYDLFANRDDCLLAVLEDVAGRVEGELAGASLDGLGWRERLRAGLWTVLCFFDREPALARLCVVQSARGGERALEWREGMLARIASVIDGGRVEGVRGGACPSLTAEGLAGAAVSILYTRLQKGRREPLSVLLGDLMGMLVLPYLGPGAASRECARPLPVGLSVASGLGARREVSLSLGEDPLGDVSMRMTYRTALVLEAVASRPGASNRAVAEEVGISDQGQVSKLLANRESQGLLRNSGGQSLGAANAWWLTDRGEGVLRMLRHEDMQILGVQR